MMDNFELKRAGDELGAVSLVVDSAIAFEKVLSVVV